MPTQTFLNLSDAKQERIFQALLTEFSHYSLADAQVARIVKEAQIARGAFYKYFADLTDAYHYVYHRAMMAIHEPLRALMHDNLQAADYMKFVRLFVDTAEKSRYYDLVKLHFDKNEALLSLNHAGSSIPAPYTGQQWAIQVLCHTAIKEILLHPDQSDKFLSFLEAALQRLV
jgi:AcrR family transcriptional regulator